MPSKKRTSRWKSVKSEPSWKPAKKSVKSAKKSVKSAKKSVKPAKKSVKPAKKSVRLAKKSVPAKKRDSKPRKDRPSPSDSATKHPVGTKMQGNDGKMYMVKMSKNGVTRWVRA